MLPRMIVLTVFIRIFQFAHTCAWIIQKLSTAGWLGGYLRVVDSPKLHTCCAYIKCLTKTLYYILYCVGAMHDEMAGTPICSLTALD